MTLSRSASRPCGSWRWWAFPLLTLCLSCASALSAAWVEQAWCDFPDTIQARTGSASTLAEGRWRGASVSVASVQAGSLEAQAETLLGAAPQPVLFRVAIPQASFGDAWQSPDRTRWAVVLKNLEGRANVFVVIADQKAREDWSRFAKSFFDVCRFIRARAGLRGVAVPLTNLVLGVPLAHQPLGPRSWGVRDGAPGAGLTAMFSVVTASKADWQDQGGFRERVESHLQRRGWSAHAGGDLALGAELTARLRRYSRDDGARHAVTACFTFQQRAWVLLATSSLQATIDRLLEALAGSAELRRTDRQPHASRILSTQEVESVIALRSQDGSLRLLWLDDFGSPVVWQGEYVQIDLYREESEPDEAALESFSVTSSSHLGLASAGRKVPEQAAFILVHLPGERSFEAHVLLQPGSQP